MLKVAAMLRTADAAHLDANRAPRFLYALMQPKGVSRQHWQFQSKLHQATTVPERQELRITGESFAADEQEAWWLAYDSCRMVDGELRAVDRILRDHHRDRFAARSLADAHSPEDFARHVPTDGWQPVDAGIKITDVKSLVERFGGERLYGDKPWLALRELLQNARDAVEACRALGGLGPEEGEIEVALESTPEGDWLHVTDTGIGMSRYVLTSVLLDFGRSLWRSADLRGEWDGLASSGFEAVGQFGIGFFSVFMLGNEVKVLTRRYEAKDDENTNALLHFLNGTANRPVLLNPSKDERLKRHGSRVSIRLLPEKQNKIQAIINEWQHPDKRLTLAETCGQLAPALSINLYAKNYSNARELVVKANDWTSLDAKDLILRIAPRSVNSEKDSFGPWLHFESIVDANNQYLARCAIDTDEPGIRLQSPWGVGVIGGINAGPIRGIVGIMKIRNQKDLARQTAVPLLTLSQLQTWVERQKTLLLESDKLSLHNSQLLAAMGCSSPGLIVAKLAGFEIASENLQEEANIKNEFILHPDSVDHDDEDEVTRNQFRQQFKPEQNLLEFPGLLDLNWLSDLARSDKDSKPYKLEEAILEILETSWGGIDIDHDLVVVGMVKSTEISHYCDIAYRFTPPDEGESI